MQYALASIEVHTGPAETAKLREKKLQTARTAGRKGDSAYFTASIVGQSSDCYGSSCPIRVHIKPTFTTKKPKLAIHNSLYTDSPRNSS